MVCAGHRLTGLELVPKHPSWLERQQVSENLALLFSVMIHSQLAEPRKGENASPALELRAKAVFLVDISAEGEDRVTSQDLGNCSAAVRPKLS